MRSGRVFGSPETRRWVVVCLGISMVLVFACVTMQPRSVARDRNCLSCALSLVSIASTGIRLQGRRGNWWTQAICEEVSLIP